MAKKSASSAKHETSSSSVDTKSHPNTPTSPTHKIAIKSSTTNADLEASNALVKLINKYFETASTRLRLIDCFMAFLVLVGVLQFVIVLIIGTYPFNAFLGGFASTIGQFVLLAGLRIQTSKANASQFPSVTPERAIADFIVGSLLLHFMVYHFIN
ncbi:uncharacterized protein SAPINGB_P005160 [Magnusiomyces paraingens]|uniref:Dolichyl-diphosphooligosaccharide--protein glycosyltransferase subunit OST2 n=1 Tax=Magnusiomyces paraingens TaxID=2606893 RepID=A0A5E8C446_9ASCO|nr:uncharacterized protein SAPINGB_P005160 [Saprochaete ingens]VVT56578.1 unnamed protein product [Saprochaete ingens]